MLLEQGIVGYIDLDRGDTGIDQYLVGRSSRPVAVAYDPVDQVCNHPADDMAISDYSTNRTDPHHMIATVAAPMCVYLICAVCLLE